MSKGMNRVTLFGNLGADPELRKTPTGVSVLKVRMATTRSWLSKEGVREEDTQWHHVAIFGNRGEGLARILRKGSYLLVEGRLHTSSYEKDGSRRYRTEIHAEDVVLGGRGGHRPDAADDHELDAEAEAAGDAWADANVRPLHAPPPRPSEPHVPELQMSLETRAAPADEPDAREPTGKADRHDPEIFEAPPEAPRPGRGDGGNGAAEAPLPATRRKGRTPAGVPAAAAA